MPPEWPHRRSVREKLLNVGIIAVLLYFALFVVVSLIAWIAVVNR